MRYSMIFLILVALLAVMPMEKAKKGEKRSHAAIAHVMTPEKQTQVKAWLDSQVSGLRDLPPTHQLLLLTTFIILVINAAIVVSYLVNSVAAITGIGISLALIFPLLVLALVWRKPRQALYKHMKKHAEFGPFVSKLTTRMWKRRFRRAAREHGFTAQY